MANDPNAQGSPAGGEPPIEDLSIRFEDPETGEVWEGTPAEVADKLFRGKQEANRMIRQQKQQVELLQGTIEQRGLREVETQPKGKQPWDQKKTTGWIGALATDPPTAIKEAMAEILGVDPSELTQTVKTLKEKVDRQEEFGQVAKFYNAVGIEEDLGPEQSRAVLDRLRDENWPADSEHMELAFYRLQKEGKIAGGERKANVRQGPPPKLPGGGGGRGNEVSDEQANAMPLDQLKKRAWA